MIAKPSRRLLTLALLSGVGLVVGVPSACNDFDHPDPLQNEVPNLIFVNPGQNSAAGGGGAGGGPADLCECTAALNDPDDPSCGSCFATQVAGDCKAASDACSADADCTAVRACLKTCQDASVADPVACQQACTYPFNVVPGALKFQAILQCACPVCGSACAYTKAPATCGVAGQGGAGGAGGAGGMSAGGGGTGGV